MKKNNGMGTNFGIRREVMLILQRTLDSSKSGLVDEIVLGRGNGAFMLAAWMMYCVSPNLSGNYYVYDYAGNFPRRKIDVEGFSRRSLRGRIKWANKRAIETLHPEFSFKVEELVDHPTIPVNTSKNLELRPRDIPIIVWGNQALIPTSWTRYAQIHGEETYRLRADFVRQTLPSLLTQGKILRRVFRYNRQVDEYLKEPSAIWRRLKDILLHQHKDVRRPYEDNSLKRIDEAMPKSFGEEAKVAFLAFSIADFRPKYRV